MRGKVIPIQLLLAVRLSSNLPLRYTQPALFPRLHLHPVESRDSARHTAMVGAASGQSLLPLHERARTFSSRPLFQAAAAAGFRAVPVPHTPQRGYPSAAARTDTLPLSVVK